MSRVTGTFVSDMPRVTRTCVSDMPRVTGTFVSDMPRVSYREQFKEGDEKTDRGNYGKTTSKCGLALNGISFYGKLRTARSGGSWL